MSDSVISHVSIAVADLDASIARFTLITGHPPHLVKEVPEQGVKVAIFVGSESDDAGGNIELVSPLSDESPVGRFITRRGEGLHHVCVYVDDLDEKLADLKAEGARLIDNEPRVGAEGDRIAFVHPTSVNGVLLELQEKSK